MAKCHLSLGKGLKNSTLYCSFQQFNSWGVSKLLQQAASIASITSSVNNTVNSNLTPSSYFTPQPEFDIFNHPLSTNELLIKQEEEFNKLAKIAKVIAESKYTLALTGAGISTESGVPDYRSKNGSYSKGHKPVMYQEFVKIDARKKKFWFRSMIYYKYTYSRVHPNKTHEILRSLEESELVKHLVTQNVDGLHARVGQRNYTELHGHLRTAHCLHCNKEYDREIVQQYLEMKNAEFISEIVSRSATDTMNLRSDGDYNLTMTDEHLESFQLPYCFDVCGEKAILKPSVVFFGENIPRYVTERVDEQMKNADCLIVMGSSLEVFSSYKIARKCHEKGAPVFIINIGPTRADSIASVKVEQVCSSSLEYISSLLLK